MIAQIRKIKLLLIITNSLLCHYYVIITALLQSHYFVGCFHYYQLLPLLPIFTYLRQGNTRQLAYEPSQLKNVLNSNCYLPSLASSGLVTAAEASPGVQ